MKIVVLGSGGREHAIGWAFYRYGFEVIHVEGNPGTARYGRNMKYIPWDEKDILVIPGSEKYIASGIADNRSNVFAPDSKGALLEASKGWAKEFMSRNNIPTAKFALVDTPSKLENALAKFNPPYVIKADGLAGGKGVIIEKKKEDAVKKAVALMEGNLIDGVRGRVVIEQYLSGVELSAMAIVSGDQYSLFPFVRDYKRVYDGGKGPNTGGMGAIGPININSEILTSINDIYSKTLRGLYEMGISYRGFLYVGLMVSEDGVYVLEYNVRLGDPETEVLVMMNPELFVKNVINAVEGKPLENIQAKCFAADVVIASEGYPYNPKKGVEIEQEPDGFAFYGGVKEDEKGKLIVSGGRVFHCMGSGMTYDEAIKEAYRCANSVHFEGAFFRKDIGQVIRR